MAFAVVSRPAIMKFMMMSRKKLSLNGLPSLPLSAINLQPQFRTRHVSAALQQPHYPEGTCLDSKSQRWARSSSGSALRRVMMSAENSFMILTDAFRAFSPPMLNARLICAPQQQRQQQQQQR